MRLFLEHKNRVLVSLLIIFLTSFSVKQTFATHAMGADINYSCVGPNTYQIFVSFYRDCIGVTPGSNLPLTISSESCGITIDTSAFKDTLVLGPNVLYHGVEVSPICESAIPFTTCNGGLLPGVKIYVFSLTITLPAECPDWKIQFSECCRNETIDNLATPGDWDLYIEASINNVGGICNNSAYFTELPVTYICSNETFFLNQGSVDIDGDSLVYQLITPLDGPGVEIPYSSPYSLSVPITTVDNDFFFDTNTGEFSFTPDNEQICVITILVEEYRDGELIGSTMRDIQIVIVPCTNEAPQLVGGIQDLSGGVLADGNSIQACPNDDITFFLEFQDVDVIENITLSSNIGLSIPAATVGVVGSNPLIATFSWTPEPSDTGFYVFTVKARDNACPFFGNQIYTFDIDILTRTWAGPDVEYCVNGDPVQLTATGGEIFSWFPPDGLSDPNSATPTASPSSTTTYILTSDLSENCINKDTIVVSVDSELDINTIDDPFICNYETVSLAVNASGNAPPGGFQFMWTPIEGLDDPNSSNPIANPLTTTSYQVITNNANGCPEMDSVIVFVDDMETSVNEDQVICRGESVMLEAEGGMGYLWEPPDQLACAECPDPLANPEFSQTYLVQIIKDNGCVDSLTTEITVNDLPVAEAGEDVEFVPGESVQLIGSGGDSYLWEPSDFLSNPNISNPVSEPESSITYVLTVGNVEGCISVDSITLMLFEDVDFIVPSAFSPNNDGLNDDIRPIFRGIPESYQFTIYNRWGRRVFSSNSPDEGWNGRYENKDAQLGTYAYVLSFRKRNQEEVTESGNIVLVR